MKKKKNRTDSKKAPGAPGVLRRVLFLLGAFVLNLTIMAVLLLAGLFLLSLIFRNRNTGAWAAILMFLLFFGCLGASFAIYRRLADRLAGKFGFHYREEAQAPEPPDQ